MHPRRRAGVGAKYAPPAWRRRRHSPATERTPAATMEHRTEPHSALLSGAAALLRETIRRRLAASTWPEAAPGGESIRARPAARAASAPRGNRIRIAPTL